MSDTAERLRIEEYRALRATIRERGSLRLIVTAITFSAWAAAILITAGLATIAYFSLVPLMVLLAGFEVAFAIHVGVERIGRYLQVHHEPSSEGQARWEQTAMEFAGASGGTHPLFPVLFLAAVLVNFGLGSLLSLDATAMDFGTNATIALPYAALHAGVAIRIAYATRFAAGQRDRDLREYQRVIGRQ